MNALATAEAARHLPPLTDKQRFLAGPIPPHILRARCPETPKPSVGPAPHMNDRVLVEIRCQGPPAWHLYVPVRIVGTTRVAVAAHAIIAGSVLTAGDLRVEQDTIVVTYYNAQDASQWKHHFENLPKLLEQEKIDSRIPWLYNFKLDFRFK